MHRAKYRIARRAPRHGLAAVLLSAALVACPRQALSFDPRECARSIEPATLEELVHVQENAYARARRRASLQGHQPAALALSESVLKIGYAAGLIVGWGETGRRPTFELVTAFGRSALLAPFAFAGDAGDAALHAVFMCGDVESWPGLATEFARFLTPDLMAVLARRHAAGARLLIAIPGSAARQESIWDLGAIAYRGTSDAAVAIADLLAAAADPSHAPTQRAERSVARNWIFRSPGAGEPFLWPPAPRPEPRSITLVYSGVLFPDESDTFVADVAALVPSDTRWIVPAASIVRRYAGTREYLQFASIKPRLNIPLTTSGFDNRYGRALYLYAYRQGRMGREWKSGLPTNAR